MESRCNKDAEGSAHTERCCRGAEQRPCCQLAAGGKIMGMKEQISVSICLSVGVCERQCVFLSVRTHVHGAARPVCACSSEPVCVRWSAVSEFGQKVNNYSAYSVIMVPVSPAAGEEGAPGRLSSSVMKYRHRGALYTWIFINTGLTVMRPEQVGWDTHIRVRSIRQEAVGGDGEDEWEKFTLQERKPDRELRLHTHS